MKAFFINGFYFEKIFNITENYKSIEELQSLKAKKHASLWAKQRISLETSKGFRIMLFSCKKTRMKLRDKEQMV